MTEAEKARGKWIAWMGLTLGFIFLLLAVNMESKIPGANLLLVYLMDATAISGFVAVVFGVLGVVAYVTVDRLQPKRKETL